MRLSYSRTPCIRGTRLVLTLVLVAAVVLTIGVPLVLGSWETHPYTAVSVSSAGALGNDSSRDPNISDDGRYVVFESRAWNLSPDDDNATGDGNIDVFLRDTVAGTTMLLTGPRAGASENDRGSRDPDISDDGRYICFLTGQDLVASDTNGDQDIYIYDRVNKTYKQLDVGGDWSSDLDDARGIRISGNGGLVVFDARDQLFSEENNGNTRDVYLHDIASDETTLVSKPRAGASYDDKGSRDIQISDDGRYVSFFTGQDLIPSDTNNSGSNDGQDLYILDRQTGTFTRADVAGDGSSEIGSDANHFSMSGNGRYVAYTDHDDLLPGDSNNKQDIYVYDRQSDSATWVTQPRAGANDPDRGSRDPSISDDGSTLVFISGQDFVASDTNGDPDFYTWDMASDEFQLFAVPGEAGYQDTDDTRISGDGKFFVFESESHLFAHGDINNENDVFIASTQSQLTDGVVRTAGANRYATALAASQDAFPLGARTVIVATGSNWPDALGGSALAGAVGGPILLTPTDSLPDSVKAEIMRLGAYDAFILGGEGAVSNDVLTNLNTMLAGPVKRLGGTDRYATSKLVADKTIEVLGDSYDGSAYVATGRGFADAMAAAPNAAGLGHPILLANPAAGTVYMPSSMDEAKVLGGEGAVPATVMDALKAALGDANVERLGGATRYDTAALIAQDGVDDGLMWNGVGVAAGGNFPDALSGGASLGLKQTVMLLTATNSLPAAAEGKLTANAADIDSVSILGGTGAVSAAVEAEIKVAAGL